MTYGMRVSSLTQPRKTGGRVSYARLAKLPRPPITVGTSPSSGGSGDVVVKLIDMAIAGPSNSSLSKQVHMFV